ncbi:MAG TPA: hypothetical protein VMW53_09785 [archaeon]|nr:hypothetical protein [archaeon]
MISPKKIRGIIKYSYSKINQVIDPETADSDGKSFYKVGCMAALFMVAMIPILSIVFCQRWQGCGVGLAVLCLAVFADQGLGFGDLGAAGG